MKKSLITIVLFLSCLSAMAETLFTGSRYENRLENGVSVIVDERVELTSIAFRLAGAQEYVTNWMPEYLSEIDSCFASFKEHELFSFIRKTREEYNFAYSIPAQASLMLEISKGHVRINREWEIQKAFDSEGELSCWTEEIFRRFVKLLDDFYRKSRFHGFFRAHEDFYAEAVQKCTEIPARVDTGWFEKFYGVPAVGIDLYLGLCNGNSNYSIPDVCQMKDWNNRLAIVIGTIAGADGLPVIMENHFPVIIHEISHYYSNPLTHMYYKQMERAMNSIFPYIEDDMAKIGYGHVDGVTVEWINELFTLAYLKDAFDSGSYISGHNYTLTWDEEKGYIWMRRAMDFMNNFYADRKLYPTIKEFMPQIVAFTNGLPEKWETITAEFENRHPYITDIYPAGGIIPEGVDIVRIRFSKPMRIGVQGLMRAKGYDMLPFDFQASYWEDERTFVIKLGTLEPGKTYGVMLNRGVYNSFDFITFAEDNLIIFKTENP